MFRRKNNRVSPCGAPGTLVHIVRRPVIGVAVTMVPTAGLTGQRYVVAEKRPGFSRPVHYSFIPLLTLDQQKPRRFDDRKRPRSINYYYFFAISSTAIHTTGPSKARVRIDNCSSTRFGGINVPFLHR